MMADKKNLFENGVPLPNLVSEHGIKFQAVQYTKYESRTVWPQGL